MSTAPSTPRLPVGFRRREPPLTPSGMIATGAVARRLARRLLELEDDHRHRLRGLGAPHLLVVLGQDEDLPWVDGVRYVGVDPAAPSVLMPTLLAPDVPAPLFETALRRQAAELLPPWLLTVDPPLLLSCARARPLAAAMVQAWLEVERG